MKSKKTRKKRRKDHFVPEAYLKGFTNFEGKFYVWERLVKKCINYMYPAQHCWLVPALMHVAGMSSGNVAKWASLNGIVGTSQTVLLFAPIDICSSLDT